MKNIISKILVFALILSTLPFAAGCTDSDTEEVKTEKLTYYVVGDSWSRFKDFAERYNRYCYEAHKDDPSYQIEFVEFSSEEEMYAKLSTELMAGTGPDLVSLEQKLPFEKLIKQNVFADINELLESNATDDEINWSEYNSTILDACSYDNKLYILPIAYGNDVLIADKNILGEYGITAESGSTFTYGDIGDTFSQYLNKEEKIPFLSFSTSPSDFLYKLIFNYVDFENEEVYFDSPEFGSALDNIIAFMNTMESSEDMDDIDAYFTKGTLFEGTGCSFTAASVMYARGGSYDAFNGFSKEPSDYNAYIQIGFAVNKSSQKTEQLTSLIRYVMGELVQEFYSDAWEYQLNSNGSSHPVRNEAFENSINNALQKKNFYGMEFEVDSEFLQTYVDITRKANKISFYEYPSQSYYAREVVNDIVTNYLNGEITKAKFIRQLTSATKIYLAE